MSLSTFKPVGIPTAVDHSFVIEQFAGPGGMSEGLKLAGIAPALTVGIEIDKDACDTAQKAGHPRVQQDITTIDPVEFASSWGWPTGLHGSPPCQGFSTAGKGVGRKDTPLILEAIRRLGYGEDPKTVLGWLAATAEDDKSALCLYPLYWALVLDPEWISMEQVPTVLPLWEAIAEVLRSNGYSVWTGNVQAEQYGVPQTRKRAILLASRVREVSAPTPTHSKFHNRDPYKLDEGVQKWVSMAEALGWGMVKRPYPTVAAGTKSGGADPQMIGGSGARLTIARERAQGEGHWIEKAVGFPRKYDGGSGGPIEIDGEEYRARDLRSQDEPAFTVTEKARSWNVYDVEVTEHPEHGEVSFLGAGLANDQQQKARAADQPAHTITGKGTACWRFDDLPEVSHMGDVYNTKGTLRPIDQPAMTLTASMDNGNFKFIDAERVKDVVAERINNQSGTEFDYAWPAQRPAAVVAGREINTAPGANGNRFNGSKKSRNDGVRVTVEEAGILQSFPSEYAWQGNKTSQFQQIGNAVPPLLGEAMIRCLLGLPSGYDAAVSA